MDMIGRVFSPCFDYDTAGGNVNQVTAANLPACNADGHKGARDKCPRLNQT
jgi:hypothetical protein